MTQGISRGATDEDWAPMAAARALHAGDRPPRVTHLIGASPSRTE
jgi:hypothetical protein